jgi:hypothetical protein
LCDFLRNLQETAKQLLLLEFLFCSKAPGINFSFAMSPLAMEGGGAGPNSGVPVGELAGKDGEMG